MASAVLLFVLNLVGLGAGPTVIGIMNDQLLVLVHLPLPDDLEPQLPPLTIAWGAFLKAVTRELELPMIDVVSSFRALGKEAA